MAISKSLIMKATSRLTKKAFLYLPKGFLNYTIILILITYIILDISMHHNNNNAPKLSVEQLPEPSTCTTVESHLAVTSATERRPRNPWKQMKWVGEAALCKVRGHMIENLDDINDFRRGYALKFTTEVEDRSHLLPWLLATREPSLARRKRRVLIDLGANRFRTSVAWFMRMYPCDFTEVHAFESNPRNWRAPRTPFDEDSNFLDTVTRTNPVRVTSTPGVPTWMMERIRIHYGVVSHRDNNATNEVDVTRFMKEELGLRGDDTVVVKMDIEGSEWAVLRRWADDPRMAEIVDELFVEVHYSSPSMREYGWDAFGPKRREDAALLLAELRFKGFYAHSWP